MARRLTVVLWPIENCITKPGLASRPSVEVTARLTWRSSTIAKRSPTSDW